MALKRKWIGVLYSGGLDSAALVGKFLEDGYHVWPVYVQCGLRWEKQEIAWAKRFLCALKSPRLASLTLLNLSLDDAYQKNWSQTGKTPGRRSDDRDVFLPARNLLLITKALLYLSSKKIYELALATLKGNPFPDATKSYVKNLQSILSKSFLKPVHVRVPFRNLTKPEVIRQHKRWPLHLSLSCINPKGLRHCGKCNKCAERQRAFREARISDKTVYLG